MAPLPAAHSMVPGAPLQTGEGSNMHQGAAGSAYTRRAVKQIDALPEYGQVFRRIFGRPVNGNRPDSRDCGVRAHAASSFRPGYGRSQPYYVELRRSHIPWARAPVRTPLLRPAGLHDEGPPNSNDSTEGPRSRFWRESLPEPFREMCNDRHPLA